MSQEDLDSAVATAKQDLLKITGGEMISDALSYWMLEYGLDSHEFVILKLKSMDEDEFTDSEDFRLCRLAGKEERYALQHLGNICIQGYFCVRYKYREELAATCLEKKDRVTQPSELLILRTMSLFSQPEEYLCIVTMRKIFPPFYVPSDSLQANGGSKSRLKCNTINSI